MTLRTCKHCGVTAEDGKVTCPAWGSVLPFHWTMLGLSGLTLRKIGLAILIPLVIWFAMRALLA